MEPAPGPARTRYGGGPAARPRVSIVALTAYGWFMNSWTTQ
jgi:hypothetical protein